MEKVPICLVGCGGMGHRHVMGYKELKDSGIGNLDLVAVCDIRQENAELVAKRSRASAWQKTDGFHRFRSGARSPKYRSGGCRHRWFNPPRGRCAGT